MYQSGKAPRQEGALRQESSGTKAQKKRPLRRGYVPSRTGILFSIVKFERTYGAHQRQRLFSDCASRVSAARRLPMHAPGVLSGRVGVSDLGGSLTEDVLAQVVASYSVR